MTEVRVIEVGVVTASIHQRFVVAFFDDAPTIQDDDAVGMPNG
jgi:hypothetical protein